MVEEYFEQAKEMISDAKQGIKRPSLEIIDLINKGEQLPLNKKIRVGNGIYMVVFGPPGTGKTSFVDTHYVVNPILTRILDASLKENHDEKIPKKMNIIYRCMERPAVDKILKFISYLMFYKFKKIIDIATLLQDSNSKRKLTEEDWDQVGKLDPYMKHIGNYLDLIEGDASPKRINDYLLSQIYRNGVYFEADMKTIKRNGVKFATFDPRKDLKNEKGILYKIIEPSVAGKKAGQKPIKIYQEKTRFVPKDKEYMLLTIHDTVNQIYDENKDDLKLLNEHTRNMRRVRDAKAAAVIDIGQMGRESEKAANTKFNMHFSLKDIKGTGNLGQNADIVLVLTDPAYFGFKRFGQDDETAYRLDDYYGAFRMFQLVKNTHGTSFGQMPCIFLGENGYFHPLPESHLITPEMLGEYQLKFLRSRMKEDTVEKLIREQELPF